jgi:hypothetical protein
MRGIHKHPRSTAIMDGPNKSGHDGEGWNGAATPCLLASVLGLGVFRDARLGWTPGGLSAEGPMTPEPFGLRVSRAAADVS